MRSDDLAPVWRALADPHRRAILDALREGPKTTGVLGELFSFSRFAVMKHLAVLVEAGLVTVERKGRERWNRLNPVPIRAVYERWVRPFEGLWSADLLRLKRHIEGGDMADSFAVAETRLEIELRASPARVWKALVEETTHWWRADYYTNPATRAFVLEAKVGGRVYEDCGDGAGLLWYTVVGIDPVKSLRLVGNLFPEYGGPANSMLTLTLEAKGKATVLKLVDHVYGRLGAGCGASLEEGWKRLFEVAFKEYVEKPLAA